MKTFSHLIAEVQDKGLCHHCGACVAFCTAINYGALELGEEGRPRYRDKDKCIECGLCYSICPEINELDAETQKLVSWSPPMGRVIGAAVGRAIDPEVRARGTDGGVITALLLQLFDRGHIDGAIVSKKTGPFQRQPWLARTRDDILEAAGFHFDTMSNIAHLSEEYSTYSPSILELKDVAKKTLRRVAFVGTPCQINALRRMEVLGVVPSDAIKIHFGLFCAGNFQFGPEERQRLERLGNFQWADVSKVNLKEDLMIHGRNGEGIRHIPLDQLAFMKRHACQYCEDYAAEYADLSFGGLGAPEGWTTVLVRTPQGREVMSRAMGRVLEVSQYRERLSPAMPLMSHVAEWSDRKKAAAAHKFQELEQRAV
jgi:coenzyme F420 hydrogenase subunit beta